MFRLALSRHIYFFAFRDTNRDTLSYCALNASEQVSVDIQLFRQRLSPKSEKAYATMSIGIMGSKSLVLFD